VIKEDGGNFSNTLSSIFNLVVNGEVLFSLIHTLHYWYKAMVQKGHQN
jgi:hypothetical protein